MLTRRTVLKAAPAAVVFAPYVVKASPWPNGPIRVIVPFSAGGASDIIARTVCEQLSSQLKTPIIIDNRAGAGGSIGATVVAKSDPDGQTILIHSITHTIAAVTYKSLPYDAVRDFAAVISLGSIANVLMVSPQSGFKTLKDLVAAAKLKPDSMIFGSAGVGSINQLSAELLKLKAGFNAVHAPYKGSSQVLVDLLAARIQFSYNPYLSAKSFIDGGTLTALAVASVERSKSLPHVPTTVESGYPDTEYPYWNAIFVPKKTPREIVQRLHDETKRAMQIVGSKLATFGAEPMTASPEEFDEIVRKQIKVNAELVKIAGIEPS